MRLRKVHMQEVMMYKEDSNMDDRMTWRDWFLKIVFVAAECHDIHGGNTTPSSFNWNIFLKTFCNSGNDFYMPFICLRTCKRLAFSYNKLVRALKILEIMCLIKS